MNVMTRLAGCWVAGAVLAHVGAAVALDKINGWPTRPIRIISASSPGVSGGSAMARQVAQMITDAWGQNVVLENRPGGSGVIAVETVARAVPDGHTFLSMGDSITILGATKRVPFEVLKAFDSVVATSSQPYVLIQSLNAPFKSIKEMIAYSATQNVTYAGGSGVGTAVHLGMERLARLSGAKLQFVAYKGSAPSIIAVMGGEIHLAVGSSIAASGAVRSGKVRALATMGLARLSSMPDLPTVAEQGFPGFKITNRYGLHAPAGTPREIVAAINRLISDGVHSPQMSQMLAADGAQPAERMDPTQFKAALAREQSEYEQMVKLLNIKATEIQN